MNLLFDLDGVLINPLARLYAIHLSLCKKYNFPPLPFLKYKNLKMKKQNELSYFNDKQTSHSKKKYLIERLLLLEDPMYLSFDTLYSGTEEVLQKLSRSYPLHIITIRKKRKFLLEQMKNLNIIQYFSSINTPFKFNNSDNAISLKKKVIRHALRNAQIKSNAVIVGDTEADIIAGRQLNLTTIAVTDRMRTKKIIESLHADFIISRVTSLNRIIKKIDKETKLIDNTYHV